MVTSLSLQHTTHTVTGFLADGDHAHPLVVCIPGGSYNARYFDVGHHSLVSAAESADVPLAALNRPGYGGSTPLPNPTFADNAEILVEAIDDLWQQSGGDYPGIVLVGHSMGGAVAIHIAAGSTPWPLLGVSATAIHVDAPDQVIDAWKSMPPEASIEFTHEQRIQFMYGAPESYSPSVVAQAAVSHEPIPVAELLEVVGGWRSDFRGLAARISVPVHYALAEDERLWIATDDTVAAFADAFTAAPSVDANLVRGCGHNIDHHHVGNSFHEAQLAWALALTPRPTATGVTAS